MKKTFKILLIIFAVTFSLLSVIVLVLTAFLAKYKDISLDDELLQTVTSDGETVFYAFSSDERHDREGKPYIVEKIADSGNKYSYVSLNDIPEDLKLAFIAIEDKRFCKHHGIDVIRTVHAAANYLFGSKCFGGSTITQQTVKNLTQNDEFRISRKITEAFYAIDLESKLTKDEILEIYLNVINLSSGCIGVGAAAEHYFSKTPSQLTLEESASIAAITNNPAKYDPIKHPENNKKRRDLILLAMKEQGYITDREYSEAITSSVTVNTRDKVHKQQINNWYIDTVIEDVISDLSAKYGISTATASIMLYRGGYSVYTAMDVDVQNIIEEYYSNVYNFPIDSNGELPQCSMVVIDPSSGDLLGIAGGVGEKKGNRIQNFATKTRRPTGSAIKPLSVYAPAIELGKISWSTVIEDSPITENKSTGEPWPQNASRTYSGKVNINYAVANSLNTVAVKVLDEIGSDYSMSFLKNKLGIKSLDPVKDCGQASLALGQQSVGMTLLELTSAYTIFADGVMSHPRSYYKVTDRCGRVILDNSASRERAISNESAAIMTKLMQSVVENGTAKDGITLNAVTEVSGKSGTTQNSCDRYFIGYTPELLAGVWMGYEYPRSLEPFGGNVSIYIWDEVMTRIYDLSSYGKTKCFKVPDTVQKLTYDTESGEIPSGDECEHNTDEGWFDVRNHNN